MRVLRKDRQEDGSKSGVVFRVVQMVVEPQRQIDHLRALRNDLGAAAKAGKIVTDIAVILLDGKGQILAGEEVVFGDKTMKAVPVVGQECVTLEPDFIEKLLAGCIITPTQKPGQSSPLDRIKRSPKLYLACLFLIK